MLKNGALTFQSLIFEIFKIVSEFFMNSMEKSQTKQTKFIKLDYLSEHNASLIYP